MWLTAQFALALLGAQPAPDAYVRVGCPFMPVAFENGSIRMEAGAREMLVQTARNLTRPGLPAPQVVLRTFTTEPPSPEREPLLEARADVVRRVLIENGFAPDHILIDRGDGESRWPAPENWHGGVVETEYFLPRGQPRRADAPESPIC